MRMDRISAAYCLFCDTRLSFIEIRARSHLVNERGNRAVYDGLKDVMFSIIAIVSWTGVEPTESVKDTSSVVVFGFV